MQFEIACLKLIRHFNEIASRNVANETAHGFSIPGHKQKKFT